MNSRCKTAILVTTLFTVFLAGIAPASAQTLASFAVLAGSTITNTGNSVINGNVGLSPGSAVTGFPPGIINGTLSVADGVAGQAKADLTALFNLLDSRP